MKKSKLGRKGRKEWNIETARGKTETEKKKLRRMEKKERRAGGQLSV